MTNSPSSLKLPDADSLPAQALLETLEAERARRRIEDQLCSIIGHIEAALPSTPRARSIVSGCYGRQSAPGRRLRRWSWQCTSRGIYPDWWQGHKFDRAIRAWAAATPVKVVARRAGLAARPPPVSMGPGMIPKASLGRSGAGARHWPTLSTRSEVRHESGDISTLHSRPIRRVVSDCKA